MSIAVNAVLRATVTLAIGTVSKAQNVYHFEHISGTSKTDEQVVTAIEDYMEALYDTVKAQMKSDVSLTKVECYELVTGAWEPFGVGLPVKVGINATERLPAGVAMLIHAYKPRTGHSDKKYLAGFCEDQISGDYWVAGAITNGGHFGDAWIPQYSGPDSVELLPISWNMITQVGRTYTGSEVGVTSSYQRRRKPGVGLT